MISFKHILGTNMVSILLRGKNTDYEFAAAITHILNTGMPQQLSVDEFHKLFDLRRFSLMEHTEDGWKVFSKHYIRKAGPLGVYLGNCVMMIPPTPTTYAELEKQGNFKTFLTPVMTKRSPAYDED